MSIDLETAHLADQSVQQKDGQYQYIDNANPTIDDISEEKENERLINWIKKAEKIEDLDKLKSYITEDKPEEIKELFKQKENKLWPE